MLKHKKDFPRVLSIYPTTRGYSYVLFSSPLSPHDWGNKDIKKDVGSAKCIESIKEMLTRFRPDVLVVEDIHERETKRTIRLKRICKAIKPAAADLSIDIAVVSRRNVRAAFAFFGATNKLEIASVIAEKIEAFAPRMPKARRSWEGQDPRMALFDAASRGLTYYYRLEEVAK